MALTLDATMTVVSPRGQRDIGAAGFFDGLWSTSMEPDELLAAISFPVWGERSGFAAGEVARRQGDFAVAGATVGVELDDDERIARCAIGLLGLGSTPERARRAEAEVRGRPIGEVDAVELGRLAMDGLDAIPSDLHGSAAYRRRVGAVMVTRAWTTASEDARG